MNLQRLALCVAAASVLIFGAARPAWAARTTIPDTVFDVDVTTIIDPNDQRLSVGDSVHIRRSHELALQQVRLALDYLRANRDDILAGRDAWYNQNFGRFYDQTNPRFLDGSYEVMTEGIRTSDVLASGSTVSVDGLTVLFPAGANHTGLLRVGDEIVIGREVREITAIATQAPSGDINMLGRNPKQFQPIEVEDVDDNPTSNYLNMITNGQNFIAPDDTVDESSTFGYPQLQSVTLDRPINDDSDLTFRGIVARVQTFDTSHLDEVVSTYEEIAVALALPTSYYADFDLPQADATYTAIFGSGGASFNIGNRRVRLSSRYGGLSNSGSQEHVGRTFPGDLTTNPPTLPSTEDGVPGLLWADDLGSTLTFVTVTINNQPFRIRVFVDEIIPNNASPFVTGFLEILGVSNGQQNQMIVGAGYLLEDQVPGGLFDGTDRSNEPRQQTLAAYQQLIAAFAEMSEPAGFGVTDHFDVNDMTDGFLDIGGGRFSPINPFPQNLDAKNFGRFADVFAAGGIGDGSTGVPLSKTGSAVGNKSDSRLPPITRQRPVSPNPPGHIIVPQG